MTQTGSIETDLEAQLRQQAANFIGKARACPDANHNLASILAQLIGFNFSQDGQFADSAKLKEAKRALDKALFTERKKARMKRHDYDPNRHIALHQASKRLDKLCAMT